MRKRRQIEVFSISFLDLLSGALGAVIILYVAIPKNTPVELEKKQEEITEFIQTDLKRTHEELEKTKEELQKSEEKVQKLESALSKIVPNNEGQGLTELDVGFKFKGRNIVFLIDTSFSMTEEDRMGQVKAGIKMLLTSFSPQYRIDIVQFPYGEAAPFKTMWGGLREMSAFHKRESFEFIYALKPLGGTPTRDALAFALKNYTEVSDIVLLSDGAPTFHNSNKKDDIYDILKMVREENIRKIQINAIGVGSEFIKEKNSERYQFLNLLTSENGGFFVGF